MGGFADDMKVFLHLEKRHEDQINKQTCHLKDYLKTNQNTTAMFFSTHLPEELSGRTTLLGPFEKEVCELLS